MTRIVILVIVTSTSSHVLMDRLRELRDGTVDLSPAQRQARQRLLATAADHFTRFGYRKASVAAIAEDAGVGKGTVYLHFDSKKTLLVACIAHEKLQLMPQLEDVLALDGSERLETFIRTVVSFAMWAPISSALLRGDRELDTVLADMDPSELAEDGAVRNRLMIDLIQEAAPNLDEAELQTMAEVITLATMLPAHLPMAAVPISTERFIDVYARLLTLGVEASQSTDNQPATEERQS